MVISICKLFCADRLEDIVHWLNSKGLNYRLEDFEGDCGDGYIELEVEFYRTPEILHQVGAFRSTVEVMNIDDSGITVWVCDIPKENPQLRHRFNKLDGHIYIPMANVVAFNTLGRILTSK